MGAKKTEPALDDLVSFTCVWCQDKAQEVKVFNGMYYHPGECLQAAIINHRLREAEKDFDEAPDETIE